MEQADRFDERDWEHFKAGGWWREPEPWFLRAPQPALDAVGLNYPKRLRAADALARVFTREACEAIRTNKRAGYGQTIALFAHLPAGYNIIESLLHLGLDLADAEPWADTELMRRLTLRTSYDAAEFEVRIWANLLRAGTPVERIFPSGGKSGDFRVSVAPGDRRVLEAKLLSPARLDEIAENLNRHLSVAADLLVPGLELQLCGSEQLIERALDDDELDEVRGDFAAIARAFRTCAAAIRQAGAVPGTYEAPPYGTIVAKPGPLFGAYSPLILPEQPAEKRARRAIRMLRRAAKQGAEIVAIGMEHEADIDLVEAQIRAEVARSPREFAPCRIVYLIDRVELPEGNRWSPICYPFDLRAYRTLTKPEDRLAEVVGSWCGERAKLIRLARPGEPGFSINTSRRTARLVSLGSASIPEGGGTISFRFDGSPPHVHPPEVRPALREGESDAS